MSLDRIVGSLIAGERDAIANMANTSAAIWQHMPQLNWVGFYIARAPDTATNSSANPQLVLGPFQGKPACIRINWLRGVCGTAAAQKRSLLVPNVDEFADHIVCDGNSRSELVVPILVQDTVVAVLDADSPVLDRFTINDADVLETIAGLLADGCDWTQFLAQLGSQR